LGVLPFLAILLIVSFIWTRSQFGGFAALSTVVLITTLPVVLTFSSLAYTDFPAACLQVSCIFVFAAWLEKPSLSSSAALGVLFGLAVLTKFTSLLYVPLAALAILLCNLLLRKRKLGEAFARPKLIPNLLLIALLGLLVVWGGYRFSVGHIDEILRISKGEMPSFQHFPWPCARLGETNGWIGLDNSGPFLFCWTCGRLGAEQERPGGLSVWKI
jgi:hypothetical protein